MNSQNHGPWIATFTGRQFDLHHPHEDDICVKDIAHSLSLLCRFTGHTQKFYSVAEHCVNVSRVVPIQFAFEGLMHDAREAYIGDVSSPLKACLPEYRGLDYAVHQAVARKFRIPFTQSSEVTEADLAMLFLEGRKLMRYDVSLWGLTEPRKVQRTLRCFPPRQAELVFLRRFQELTGDRFL